MPRPSAVTIVRGVLCLGALGIATNIATNVATGALPESWDRYLWLAWPALPALLGAAVVIEIRRARAGGSAGADSPRARVVLLDRVRRYWVRGVLERSLYQAGPDDACARRTRIRQDHHDAGTGPRAAAPRGRRRRAPIPVVLTLSSWALRREPLGDWIARELAARYEIPASQGRSWLDTDQLIPLLDGLDEVAGEHQTECVKAINDFRAHEPVRR